MPRERSRTRDRAALALLAATAALLLCFHTALADPVDVQQRALRGHLTLKRSVADCAHVLRLTPEEAAELGWFHYHRALTDCKDVDELLNDDIKTPAEKDKDNTKTTIDNEFKNTIDGREGWKPTTPDEIKARADADARDKKLTADQAELDAKQAEFAKQQAATEALVKANEAKRKEYLEQLQKESEARAADVQKVRDARNQAELDRVQKLNDDIRAAQDAKTREQHAAAEKADLERQKADQDARAAENERLAKDKAQRDADKLQQEADERQAEADKQSADEEQKAKNAAQRQHNAETRAANEQARQQRETEFRANEKARLGRERDAETARLEREKTEAEIKKEEEARAQREKNLDENQKALAAREKEFAEADAARADRLKKMKEDEDARAAEEQKVRDVDKDKADEIDDKQKDLDKRNEEIPDEEKPKRDDEDDCDSSGGDKVTCHNGGKCFQLRSDPSKKRCKCEKGYKGEKCEYASCSVTGADKKVKTGNKVDGKCVRWDSEYNCPGCNKNWNLVVQCVEIGPTGKEKNVSSHDCSKMKKPENKFKDEMCKYCLTGCGVKTGKRHLREESVTTSSQRRLVTLPPTTGTQYLYAPGACGNFLDHAFIYSTQPHVFSPQTQPVPSRVEDGISMENCLSHCWNARGHLEDRTTYYEGTYPLTKDHCTWVFWQPDAEKIVGKCHMYNNGELPRHAGSGPVEDGGYLAFASFTRRFDISRGPQCNPLNRRSYLVGVERHAVCFGYGRSEGEGTFYLGNAGSDPNAAATQCPATYGTMLDAALHFEKLSREPQELANLVRVPIGFQRLSTPTIRLAALEVVSTSSEQSWAYSVDHLGRVDAVSSDPYRPLPPSNINGGGRNTISPSEYQKIFNYEMHNSRVSRPFQAGHLVAAAQKPPNFFFNYVPQHGNSNSNGGCWWFTEIAASDFQRMGCHISYDIVLTYPEEGNTPAQTGKNRPQWVRDRDQPSSYDVHSGVNGIESRCHFRYRPVTMSLTFQVKGADAGTTCENLRNGHSNNWDGRMLEVVEDSGRYTLKTSRLKAYLLQKWTLGYAPERAPPRRRVPKILKKLYSVATTMLNRGHPDLACFAETGKFYKFERLEFTPDFKNAFLSRPNNGACLGLGEGNRLFMNYFNQRSNCVKWTYPSGAYTDEDEFDFPQGKVVFATNDEHNLDTGKANCILVSTDTIGTVNANEYINECAKFVYASNPAAIVVDGDQATPAADTLMVLDSLVEGFVMNRDGTFCLKNAGDVMRFEKTDEGGCYVFRVSYYPISEQLSEGIDEDIDDTNSKMLSIDDDTSSSDSDVPM